MDGYRKDLASFARWYRESSGRELVPADVTSIDLREYQGYLQSIRGLKPASVNRYLTGVRRWLAWAKEAGHIDRLPSFPRQVPRQRVPPKALERKEQNRLLREAERRGKARDLALVRLLLSCGLRVGEAVALRVSDLDLGERHGRVVVRRGKGNKYRVVPVPVEARKAIREWLAERGEKFPGSEWLFPSRKGGHISTRYVEQVVAELARRANVECTPHTLRHTCATNMLRTGADLVAVAQVLGHENLNTTAVYTRPDERTMAEALEKGEI